MSVKFMSLEDSRASGWKFYRAAMKGQDYPIHPHYVPIGFFKVENRHKTKSWPLAIWESEEGKFAQIGDSETISLNTIEAEQDFIDKTFQWCSRKPIDYSAYEHWKKHRAWPDTGGAEAVIAESQAARNQDVGIGHNSGEDPVVVYETLKDQVQSALKGLERFKAVDSDDKAGEAQSLRSRLNELAGEGDKTRTAEKKPHLDAARAVDDKWQPTIKEAKDGANVLRRAIEAHETAKMRAERERKAAEAAASKPIVTSAADPAPVVAPAPAAAPAKIGGAYGRATSAKTRKQIDTIDYRQVCDQFVDTNDELKAVLKKIAQRAVDIGAPVNGVTTIEVARVR